MMLSGMGTVRAPAMGRAAEPSIVVDRGIFARETAPGRHQNEKRKRDGNGGRGRWTDARILSRTARIRDANEIRR